MKRFFAQVAPQSPLPIIIYNFPAVCNGLDLDSGIIAEIARMSLLGDEEIFLTIEIDGDHIILGGVFMRLWLSVFVVQCFMPNGLDDLKLASFLNVGRR